MTHERPASGPDTPAVEVQPPIPAFSWMGSLSPLLLGPILAVVAVALFAPDNVLEQWSLTNAFTDWMKLKLPFISKHAASTIFPEVALLVNCLTVALIPVLSLVWLTQSFVNYPKLTRRLDVPTHLFVIFAAIPFCLFVVYVMVALPDPSWAKGLTTHRRGGMALLSAFVLYGCSMSLGGWILMIRMFVDLHMRRGD